MLNGITNNKVFFFWGGGGSDTTLLMHIKELYNLYARRITSEEIIPATKSWSFVKLIP